MRQTIFQTAVASYLQCVTDIPIIRYMCRKYIQLNQQTWSIGAKSNFNFKDVASAAI